jgi:benzoyl-CoA reductase/2-hydroxyglutaryl-CoA dehydratase subunit BcrC/BadD/HgdB
VLILSKTVVYSCPYIPAEWIAAHRLRPSRILCDSNGTNGPIASAEGVCPYVRCFINTLGHTNTEALILTTVCDQMRRAYDIVVRNFDLPAILINVPSTWKNSASLKLYQDELKRLSLFLSRIGGKKPTEKSLAKTMIKFNSTRDSLIKAAKNLKPRQYSEAITEFHSNGNFDSKPDPDTIETKQSGIPLTLLGGPMLKEDFQLVDTIEAAGGSIVLDATETGERGLCPPFNQKQIEIDPFNELAAKYFHGIADVSRRPNNMLYDWLISRLKERNVRGIIFKRFQWCDLWHAELHRLRETLELPILDIDSTSNPKALQTRNENRITAFLEMLA